MDTGVLWQDFQKLLEDSAREYEQVQKELKEMDILLRQSMAEVDKLTRQNTQLMGKIRQMEANLDSYPPRVIHNTYKQAQAVQMRLFMMRGQMEQLQAKQQGMERYARHLRRLMELGEQLRTKGLPSAPVPKMLTGEMMIRIIEAREKERRALARQMHDGPAQALTNLILQAEICEKLFSRDRAKAREELENLKRAANETFQQVRSFIFNLRPMMLDDLGLIPTLRRYAQEFENKSGIKTLFTLTGKERKLASYLEVILFRAIQELLNNVNKHANASQVQIHIDIADDRVTAIVEDNGIGFDTKVLSPSQSPTIASIQENIQAVGGQLQVQSSLGKGTRVTIEVPLIEEGLPET
ncbi:MAG: sensor histidine kinase [Chloroflexi bacterium]|nr:MAG: sensor histidine kinase [Chloroflexota bacterium]HDN79397.1 sensor histidine kinase [Chloroflexota bacterium]